MAFGDLNSPEWESAIGESQMNQAPPGDITALLRA